MFGIVSITLFVAHPTVGSDVPASGMMTRTALALLGLQLLCTYVFSFTAAVAFTLRHSGRRVIVGTGGLVLALTLDVM